MHRPQFTIFLLIFWICILNNSRAQVPDQVYSATIHSIKLTKMSDPLSYPVLELGSIDQLDLQFDEVGTTPKNFYYTLQLCQADWSVAALQPFDYWRGFISNRIRNYRPSSLSQIRYIHYQAAIPETNSGPTRSGNYLLKVFLNNDTSQLIFTRRVLVVAKKIGVTGMTKQPFDGQLLLTHQQLPISVTPLQQSNTAYSPTELRVYVVQNRIWATAHVQKTPTVFRGNYFEYSDESFSVFPAGQEWRWVDLRSFRLRSERVSAIVDSDTSSRVDIYVNPDGQRTGKMSLQVRDINGAFQLESRDNPIVGYQGEYGWVHFTYSPPGGRPFMGRDVFVFGELTGYQLQAVNKMDFDAEKGCYTKALFLKQGYYNYSYVTNEQGGGGQAIPSSGLTEGNYWGTENEYMVLVYVRTMGSRADELIGYTLLHSAFQR
jgi:hypothetical protein